VIYKYSDTAILVFCKAPIAGQVKTRLIPDLSAQQAVDVHIELTKQILSLLSYSQLCPIQLWCAPDTRHPFFSDCVDAYQLSLHKQQGDDLGHRMDHAISTALGDFSKVLLVGSDCPSLTVADFEFAVRALQSPQDVVLAPAEDGGYVMIGMSKPYPELFSNMTWGDSTVLDATHQRLGQAGLIIKETRQQWDVDTFNDLQRFYQQ
jgi:uncharacterized protein